MFSPTAKKQFGAWRNTLCTCIRLGAVGLQSPASDELEARKRAASLSPFLSCALSVLWIQKDLKVSFERTLCLNSHNIQCGTILQCCAEVFYLSGSHYYHHSYPSSLCSASLGPSGRSSQPANTCEVQTARKFIAPPENSGSCSTQCHHLAKAAFPVHLVLL